MKKAVWLIKNSLILDWKFTQVSRWGFFKKIDFLVAKYYLIIKHFFQKFKLGSSFTHFSGKKIYYDSQYGLAGYQSILSRHQKLILLEGKTNVKTIIDVGANVGFFSLLAREMFPECEIFALEPIPQTFKCLEQNFSKDNSTKCFNIGLADFSDIVKMKFDEDDSAISAIDKEGSVDATIKTLDDFVLENNITAIDLLKIDTETFEAHVLRGGAQTLAKTKYLFMEITLEDNQNYTLSSLMKLLATDEYEFQLVGFRNYADTAEGEMPIMDAFLKNVKFSGK